MDLNRWPVRTTLLRFLFFAGLVAIVFRYNSRHFFLQVLWFYLVGLIFLWLHWARNKEMAQTFDWERQAFGLLAMVGLFAVFVYGHIRSGYGGGAPILVDVTFARPISFSTNKTESGFLIDQDSQGYYLVHKAEDTETHFIPRDAVGEMVFHGGGGLEN